MGDRSNINLVGNTTQGINIGRGAGVFKSKTLGNLMSYKTVTASGSTRIYETDDELIIWSNSGGTGVYNVTNGLTQFADDIKLGGHLTENTEVSGGTTYSMTFDTQSMYMCNLPAKSDETNVVYVGTDGKLAAGVGGGGAGSAANGLCVCGDNITLGGDLTGTTNICLDGNNFNISGTTIGHSLSIGTCSGAAIAGLGAEDGVYCAHQSNAAFNGFLAASAIGIYDGSNCTSIAMTTGGGGIEVCDTIGETGFEYKGDYSTLGASNPRWVPDNAYITGLTSGGSGGFLGLVTEATAEPTDLQDNQWVKPAPTAGGVFNYTFDNFADSGATAISVNLSLEDVSLRYCEDSSGYWVKEGYDKPITSGHTWIGDLENKVCEVQVINEWVGTVGEICYTGQKFTYPTQTISQVDIGTCVTTPNKIFIDDIDLKTVGNTCIFTIPSGKSAILIDAKLVMTCDATPTSYTVSIGNNSCSTASLSYNNMMGDLTIDDVLENEVYDLVSGIGGAAYCDGSCLGDDVYIRVQSASTHANALCGRLVLEGYVY